MEDIEEDPNVEQDEDGTILVYSNLPFKPDLRHEEPLKEWIR